METLTLLPLSQGELAGKVEGFIDRAFDARSSLVSARGAKPTEDVGGH